jgi:hypothetical protein
MTPSLTPTTPPLATSTQAGTSEPTATESQGDLGPLSFHYEIVWRLDPSDPMQSIATVTITASGGGGGYEYFWDTFPVDGPIFEYTWRSCYGDPHSITVTSADGQSVTVKYFQNPPCPTPTPTP